ncbi:MAG: type II toxin-antitoxin system Phd/YefM family antitoxin [Acidimicrobiia bacterium]|jgi:prevent-host-death family protein
MESIGVRELRQQASRYLARVAAGESFEVTDRGRPVARLVPVLADRWEELLRSGWVVLPDDDSDLLAEEPSDFGLAASEQLARQREHER